MNFLWGRNQTPRWPASKTAVAASFVLVAGTMAGHTPVADGLVLSCNASLRPIGRIAVAAGLFPSATEATADRVPVDRQDVSRKRRRGVRTGGRVN